MHLIHGPLEHNCTRSAHLLYNSDKKGRQKPRPSNFSWMFFCDRRWQSAQTHWREPNVNMSKVVFFGQFYTSCTIIIGKVVW